MPHEKTSALASRWIRESRKGYIGLAVLLLLRKSPLYGYSIMKRIREMTHGTWKPTPGGIYPVLKKLESYGLIEGYWEAETGRRRKLYKITSDGVKCLDAILESYRDFVTWVNKLLGEAAKEVGEEHAGFEDLLLLLEDRRRTLMRLIKKLEETLSEIDEHIKELKKLSKPV